LAVFSPGFDNKFGGVCPHVADRRFQKSWVSRDPLEQPSGSIWMDMLQISHEPHLIRMTWTRFLHSEEVSTSLSGGQSAHLRRKGLLLVTRARQFYEELEAILRQDHHFWLQRGSLELEDGYLKLAQNFLGQAEAINPNDPLVICTSSHLLFRRALRVESVT
jgi:hypothetical protein